LLGPLLSLVLVVGGGFVGELEEDIPEDRKTDSDKYASVMAGLLDLSDDISVC
jgi:hypothetical protein